MGEPGLALDLTGRWRGGAVGNCTRFAEGFGIFTGRESLVPLIEAQVCSEEGAGVTQNIWQDCLELTITGGGVLHHHVQDGQYVTDDFHLSGKPIRYRAFIEAPLPHEQALGATAVSVFRPENERGEVNYEYENGAARRFITSGGKLRFYQELVPGYGGTFELERVDRDPGRFPLGETLFPVEGCSGYDPQRCEGRNYTDTSESWTWACCEAVGDDALKGVLNSPPPPAYGGGFNPKWQPCGSLEEVDSIGRRRLLSSDGLGPGAISGISIACAIALAGMLLCMPRILHHLDKRRRVSPGQAKGWDDAAAEGKSQGADAKPTSVLSYIKATIKSWFRLYTLEGLQEELKDWEENRQLEKERYKKEKEKEKELGEEGATRQ